MTHIWVVAAEAVLAGATASVAGAGSLLTPLLALRFDFKVAVALAAIPHLAGGAARLIPLRRELDWGTVRTFGATCALAAMAGALLHDLVASVWLTRVFAVCGLLVLAGLFTRFAAVPLLVDMLVAIASTKVPILLGRGYFLFFGPSVPKTGFWSMPHEARTDLSMLLSSGFLLVVGAGALSFDEALRRQLTSPDTEGQQR